VTNRLRDGPTEIDLVRDGPTEIDQVQDGPTEIDLVRDGPMVIDQVQDGPTEIDLVRDGPMAGVQEEKITQAKIDLVPSLLDIGRQDPVLRVTVLPATGHRAPFIFRSITPGIGAVIGDGIGGITTKTGGPGRRQAL